MSLPLQELLLLLEAVTFLLWLAELEVPEVTTLLAVVVEQNLIYLRLYR
jgi:hypothetical protein